jgi:hypothetical protein
MINMIFGMSAAKTKSQKEAQRLLNKKCLTVVLLTDVSNFLFYFAPVLCNGVTQFKV